MNWFTAVNIFWFDWTAANVVKPRPFRVCQFTSWLLPVAFTEQIGITENVVVELKVFAFAWTAVNVVKFWPNTKSRLVKWLSCDGDTLLIGQLVSKVAWDLQVRLLLIVVVVDEILMSVLVLDAKIIVPAVLKLESLKSTPVNCMVE